MRSNSSCDRLAFGQAREHVALAMFENENALQRRALRESEVGFAVPRVPYMKICVAFSLALILSTIIFANRMLADDNTVIAQNFDLVQRSPETCCCAFASA